ncbi:MAG: carboxypeptidase-like regulatory domain-containing protein [Bacteroidales bacterium]
MKRTSVISFVFTLSVLIVAMFSCEKEKVSQSLYGSIEGVVKNNSDLKGLEGVSITTKPASIAPLTDKNGVFLLKDVPIGDVVITARKQGFNTSTLNVSVQASTSTQVSFLLTEASSQASVSIHTPTPKDGSGGLPLAIKFIWSKNKPKDVELTYRFRLLKAVSGDLVVSRENLSDTTCQVSGLEFNTTYLWDVQAYVGGALQTTSKTFRFTTQPVSDLALAFARMENSAYHVYIADTGSTNLYRIPGNSNAMDWNPQFSHTGNALAFVSTRNQEPRLFLADNLGANPKQVSTIPIIGYNNFGNGYCWSPDDKYFLICSHDKLYRLEKDGSNKKLIATAPAGKNFKYCDWNANTGKILVMTSSQNVYQTEVYLMNEDGSMQELIINDKPGMLDSPSFSIAGDKILYSYDPSEFENSDGRQLDANIYWRNLTTKKDSCLSRFKSAGTNDLYPRFSPNNAFVVFVNTDNTGQRQDKIYSVELGVYNRRKWWSNATTPNWRP